MPAEVSEGVEDPPWRNSQWRAGIQLCPAVAHSIDWIPACGGVTLLGFSVALDDVSRLHLF